VNIEAERGERRQSFLPHSSPQGSAWHEGRLSGVLGGMANEVRASGGSGGL